MHCSTKRQIREKGAVAVEFALIAPALLLLLAGIVEFAYAFNIQISVTQASREAARSYSITNDWSKAKSAAIKGAPGLEASRFSFPDVPAACAAGSDTSVTVKYTADSITGFTGTFVTTGKGAMRCGG